MNTPPEARSKPGLKERINALVLPVVAVWIVAQSLYILSTFVFETREPFPPLQQLRTAHGTIADLEQVGNGLRLRLSGNDRWFVPLLSDNDEAALYERLDRVPENDPVTVIHAAEPSVPPHGGWTWKVAAYAISVKDTEVFTIGQAQVQFQARETELFWWSVALLPGGALTAAWAWTDRRKRRANRGTR